MEHTFPPLSVRDLSHSQMQVLSQFLLEQLTEPLKPSLLMNLLLEDLKENREIHNKLITRTSSSKLTPHIQESKKIRNRAMRLFIDKIKIQSICFDETLRTGALILLNSISHHGGKKLINFGRFTVSAGIEMIIHELSTPEKEAILVQLGIVSDFQLLVTSHTEFESAVVARQHERSESEALPFMRDIRLELETGVRKILESVEYLFKKRPDIVDEQLFKTIRYMVVECHSLIALRSALSKKEILEESPEIV